MSFLILTGGGNRRSVIPRYVEAADGGQIAVITTASADPDMWRTYKRELREYGARRGQVVHITGKDERVAEEEALLRECHAAVLTGGKQERLVSELDPRLKKVLLEFAEENRLVAATSAGTMAVAELMIEEGESGGLPTGATLPVVSAGLGLVCGVIFETHDDRGRWGRLLGALAQHPECLGVGLDAGASLRIKGGTLTAITGGITVMDPANAEFTALRPGESLGAMGVLVHTLPAGGRLHIPSRECVLRP